jgi:hypothetical protein
MTIETMANCFLLRTTPSPPPSWWRDALCLLDATATEVVAAGNAAVRRLQAPAFLTPPTAAAAAASSPSSSSPVRPGDVDETAGTFIDGGFADDARDTGVAVFAAGVTKEALGAVSLEDPMA